MVTSGVKNKLSFLLIGLLLASPENLSVKKLDEQIPGVKRSRKQLGAMSLVVHALWRSKVQLFQSGKMETVIRRSIRAERSSLMIAKIAETVRFRNHHDVISTSRTVGGDPSRLQHQHRLLLRCWILPIARIQAGWVTLLQRQHWSLRRLSLGPPSAWDQLP